MDSRTNNTTLRSVPLIQRGDLARMSSWGSGVTDAAVSRRTRVYDEPMTSQEEKDAERVERRERRRRRTSQREASSQREGTTVRRRARRPERADSSDEGIVRDERRGQSTGNRYSGSRRVRPTSLTSVSMFEGSAANASWRIIPHVASTQDARDGHGFGSHGATNATKPYPDESGVTGVSRRSERRSATGLTLVPESSEPPRPAASWSNWEWDAELLTWGTESAREDDRRSAERRDRRSNRRREEAPAYEVRSALYTEDDYRADNGASRPMRRGIFSGFGPRTGSAEDGRVASRSSRREETPGYEVRSAFYTEEDYRAGHGASPRRNRAGRVGRSVEAPSYEVRSAFYTEKDFRAQRGIPGADRRRMAVAEALAAAPRAVGGTLVSVLVRARVLVLILLLALMMLGFYKPVRELYVAQRRLDVLQATYDALAEDNDTISDELYLLQTREGIENEARARGFVEPGETKVIVEGLPEEMAGPNGTAVTVSEVEVNIEDPWYIELFDKVFEYNGEA